MTREYLTTKEAAEIAGLSPERIRQLCKRSLIACRKFGERVWQVDAQSLEEWIKKRGQ